jgi:hypothetical protein
VLLAAGAAAALAGTTAAAVDGVLRPAQDPPPRLRAAPPTMLSQLGVTLAAARPPAYCGLVSAAAERGITKPGAGGCPISRQAADAVARGRGLGTVLEAVLARASMPRIAGVGTDRVVWLLVAQNRSPALRFMPMRACPATRCAALTRLNQLVFVDASTAKLLATIPAGLPHQGIVAVPRPPPAAALPTTTLPESSLP